MFNKLVSASCVSTLLLTTACGVNSAGEPRFCERNKEACAIAAALIIGGIIAASNDNGSSGGNTGGGALVAASDRRLKTDIREVGELSNGLVTYAFRYIGGTETFVGVMADELLSDPRYAFSVIRGEDGFLSVDYSQLPVEVIGMNEMRQAGERALERIEG